jgi:DNA-binding NtrC family response regulator
VSRPASVEAYLTLRGVPRSLWSYAIVPEPQTIGRQADCPVRVGDRSVSRAHAAVWQQNGELRIRDLKSSNGTRVNDARVQEAPLQVGDTIRLGEVVLEVCGPEDSAAPASTTKTTLIVADRPLALNLDAMQPAWLPLREEVAALYSLGGTLGNCAQRSEAFRAFLDWLREWLGVSQAAVILRTKEGPKVAAHGTWSDRSGAAAIYWPAVRESFSKGEAVRCALSASATGPARPAANGAEKQVVVAWLPDVKPAGVVYAEWLPDKTRAQQGYPELIHAAAQVLASALTHLGQRPVPKKQPEPAGAAPASENLVLKGGEAMRPVFEMIRQAAAVDATVLITGETGTGKELVARAIHQTSPRKRGPFIARNCSAFPESLFESELFGHEAGAFTGASKRHQGVFEQADGGTLFLDEIGEIPLHLQTKLLRVLEDQTLQRVGGRQTVQVNVRVIAATNRNLAQAVQDGSLRQDLYYRLQVFTIQLPPLRERPGDIRRLAEYFLAQACRRMKAPEVAFDSEALAKLEAHTWPGNVRELRNTVERAVILSEGQPIGTEHIILTENPGQSVPIKSSGSISLDDIERQHIQKVLASVGGNKAKAASILGIDRTTLHRKLRRLAQGGPDAS